MLRHRTTLRVLLLVACLALLAPLGPSYGRGSAIPGPIHAGNTFGWYPAAWRLATDWADYAAQVRELLDAEPLLEGGPVPRWAERPVTKFERKGVAAGREIADLAYARSAATS